MNKRDFLKLSGALITGAVASPLAACKPHSEKSNDAKVIKNWSGNITYSTGNLHEPKSVDEAREIILKCSKVRVLGTRHCFNTIADSSHNLLSTRWMNEIGPVNVGSATITVGSGIRYGDLCKTLYEKGLALHNLASLPHISVAGACATATHGSGVMSGNLSTAVSAIELLTASGELITLSRADPEFAGAIVNLGVLGMVTKVTLDLQPAFNVAQRVYLGLPMSSLEAHFDEIMSAGYSVSLFTDWQTDFINQVWVKKIVKDGEVFDAPVELFGARLADRDVHPIIEISAENCTPQMGVAGPWYERLPHFKMNFTPSSGEELQAEYFVPRSRAVEAIQSVAARHREELKTLLFISEIRTIAADDLWLSTAYDRDSVAIHFTLKQNTPAVAAFLPRLEETLRPFDPRPHWGKQFAMSGSTLRSKYSRINEFRTLVAKWDPEGKFSNDFIEAILTSD